MPAKTRESPFSSAAFEKPRKLRDTPGNVELVVSYRSRSPKSSVKTPAAAEPTTVVFGVGLQNYSPSLYTVSLERVGSASMRLG